MTPNEFVECLRKEVLEEHVAMYAAIVTGTATDRLIRTQFAEMMAFGGSLTEAQQREVVSIIRQVLKDTLSTVLGILDGPVLLRKHRGEFHLFYEDDPELTGDLQDLFLAAEEEK